MMRSGPSKGAERAVGLLIPPACREEVLGDLHERYMGPSRYFADALTTVPLVILARIRRTTDASVALMEALVLYLAFVGAAKYRDDTLLESPWGLARLAIPSAVTLLFLALHDAYAGPGRRSTLNGPVFAVAAALLSQGVLALGGRDLALPVWTRLCGGAAGLLMVSTVRLLFPPLAGRPQGASGPAFWMEQAGEPIRISRGSIRVAKGAVLATFLILVAREGHFELAAFAGLLWFVYALAKGARRRE